MAAALLRRPWSLSIALRLTVWYALSAFTLIFAATAFLYWVLVTNLVREDARFLADQLDTVRMILRAAPAGAWTPSLNGRALSSNGRQLYVRLLDRRGVVVLETSGMRQVLPPPAPAALAAVSSRRVVGESARAISGAPFQTLTAPAATDDPSAGYIQVAMNRAAEEHLLALYRARLLWVLSLSLIACAAVGLLIARAGIRPIQRIGRTAERFGSSTLHERIPIAGLPAELSTLAQAFNSMLDRLEDSFTRVTRFSDDVAHELRTPINNLRGSIEVALARPRSQVEYGEVLSSCLEESGRLSRVVQSLLFLARADNATEPLQLEMVDVARELRAVADFYEASASEAGIALALVAQPLHAMLNRTLLQQAVGNLVSNALAHTPRGGSIQIVARRDDTGLCVVVADTGQGIPADQLPHVFDRFFRADPARSGSDHNVGLGLSVVKSIVERHGGRAEISSQLGRGSEVRLTFPVTPNI